VGPRNHDGGPNPLTGKALQGKCDGHPFDNGRNQQERPQDFGQGVNAPLPPEAKKILKI